MDVAIIGGGIGGLAAALYLQGEGIRATVYEAGRSFSELGVGINLLAHAIRKLDELGLVEAIAKFGLEPRETCFFNRHGQLIHSEPCGRHAGYRWPHYSVNRADLHAAFLAAVRERLGPDAVVMGHRCIGIAQDEERVTIAWRAPDGRALPSTTATVALGCDGVHSAVRRQFYPEEGAFAFAGINMWRGSTRYRPILSGRSIVLCGALSFGKLIFYPMRDFGDGTVEMNWNVEVKSDVAVPNSWNRHGRLEDFLWRFEKSRFDWLDVPDILSKAEMVLEYPMVDRDPVAHWSFGRVTLLGDAAHPMYPRSGNGAAQAIIDASVLAPLLKRLDPVAALAAYEAERLETVNRIVVTSRSQPVDFIIETVEARTGGEPFGRLEDVISRRDLAGIIEQFYRITGADRASVNRN